MRSPPLLALLLLLPSLAHAAAPPLREQVSLNGDWNGQTVPEYRWQIVGPEPGTDDDVFRRWCWTEPKRVYTRSVTVPPSWKGKRVVLEVERANFKPTVSVDGKDIATFLPPYVPFTVDLTPHVVPGKAFELAITVHGHWIPEIKSEQRGYLWPVGGWCEWGILGDVWLRAYGPVAIEDAFIRTSVRERELRVDYTVHNTTHAARTVQVVGTVSPAAGGDAVKTLKPAAVTLAAGERKTVSVRSTWNDPVLWHPGNPHLYHLQSRLLDGTTEVDGELRRFGFREIWIDGTTFRLNGTRLNLRGDNTAPHGPRYHDNEAFYTPATFDGYLAFLRSVNANVFRHHTYPAARFMLERCDETGMLVIDESALRGDKGQYDRRTAILDNTRDRWIGPWIRSHRNHPSLIMWSAENEGFLWNITDEDMASLGRRIKEFDDTRPVCYAGDRKVPGEIKSLHYPEGYTRAPRGRPGTWRRFLDPERPTQFSEFLTMYRKDTRTQHVDNFWWQGTWSRGLRRLGVADLRPYTLAWAAGKTWAHFGCGKGPMPIARPGAARNLANSFHPVALFDVGYDALGIAPLTGGELPRLAAGAEERRELALFNDEFAGERVEVVVQVRSGDTVHATGSVVVEVTLGEHVLLDAAFQVPAAGGRDLELVRSTRKDGQERFREASRFIVDDGGWSGSSRETVAVTVRE